MSEPTTDVVPAVTPVAVTTGRVFQALRQGDHLVPVIPLPVVIEEMTNQLRATAAVQDLRLTIAAGAVSVELIEPDEEQWGSFRLLAKASGTALPVWDPRA